MTAKRDLVGWTQGEFKMDLPGPKCQTSIIESSMTAVVDDEKTSRTLKPFNKRFEGLIKSLVGLSIWNQGSFDPETIGFAEDRSQFIDFSMNPKIVVLPTKQKNVHSSVGVPNLWSPKLSGETVITRPHGTENLKVGTTRLKVT